MFMSNGGNMCLRKFLITQTGRFYGTTQFRQGAPNHTISPDITFFNKQSAETTFIDVSFPKDSHISQKSIEKKDKYHDLV